MIMEYDVFSAFISEKGMGVMRKEKKGSVYNSGHLNPFLPLNIYIPDVEPKVFGDRVYLYGSKDLFGGEYCCYKYHVYSAPVDNLREWTDHGPVLASRNDYLEEGIEASIPWSDGLLWAPDVIEWKGKFYLYFCQSDGTEGVAESDVPYGPFVNPRQITMDGEPIKGIDPSVLEHNGAVYYTWGQGHCHMAKLNDDMCSLDSGTYAEAIVSSEPGEQGFHEGSSLRKIGDWFCMVYASEYKHEFPNRGSAPTKLDYAVSKDIYGPYERRGTIINNFGIDPQSWNNHGSILKIKDQWYVCYHGSSNNCKYTRRARIAKINVDEVNGYIEEAEMTSVGFGDVINPLDGFEVAHGYKVTGGAYFTQTDEDFPLVNITDGCSVSYRYLDFSEKDDWKLYLNADCLEKGEILVYLNETEVVRIPIEKGMRDRESRLDLAEYCVTNIARADLRLEFVGETGKQLLELKEIRFS